MHSILLRNIPHRHTHPHIYIDIHTHTPPHTPPYFFRGISVVLMSCVSRLGGQLVLQDIDITSKTEANSMRRLNTLAHYGVKEKVMVSLVPKQIDSPSHHIYQVRAPFHLGTQSRRLYIWS
jgi:hypothetical protein